MIKEKMNNMDNMMAAQEQEAQEALEELRASTATDHVAVRGTTVRLASGTLLTRDSSICSFPSCIPKMISHVQKKKVAVHASSPSRQIN